MIDRYSRVQMKKIWTDENKFKTFLKIEILSCYAWSEIGTIPIFDVKKIEEKACFDLNRIYEIEKETKHDVVAFTRTVSESLGEEKKWLHYGLTSTDVVDTANGYIFKQANDILAADILEFMGILKQQAIRYKKTPCIGRTHGMHADITCFGLKFVLWYEEMKRNLDRFILARRGVEAGKISGAVGNFANIPPYIQNYVCEKLGLESANVSTQILQRDRHAFYLATLATIASSLEQMALEIRHLQRTEVHEVEENFSKGQKGSSAMPHKKNPISSENICGCSRVMRGYMHVAYENMALWHERDISHSSAERIIFPDATILLDYMLHRFGTIIQELIVYPEIMEKNIYKTNGIIFSQRVMNALIGTGLSREEAYDLLQPLAMQVDVLGKNYKDLLMMNIEVTQHLTKEQIEDCFSLDYYFKNIEYIYNKCFQTKGE